MNTLVINGSGKSDFKSLIALAKKLGLTVKLVETAGEPLIFNNETIKALKQANSNRKMKRFASVKSLMDDLYK